MITLLFCEVRPLTFLLLKYSCHTSTIVCLDRRHTGSFQLKSFVKHWTVIIDRNAVIRSLQHKTKQLDEPMVEKEVYMDTAEETRHFVLKVWWHHVSLMFKLKEYLIRVSQCYEWTASIVIISFLFLLRWRGKQKLVLSFYRTSKRNCFILSV